MRGPAVRLTGLFLLGVVLLLTPALPISGQEKPETMSVATQEESSAIETAQSPDETVHPGPQSLKEKWAIGVFLIWMWLSIAVLVYFIRLQIREADRITGMGYDSPVRIHRDKRTS